MDCTTDVSIVFVENLLRTLQHRCDTGREEWFDDVRDYLDELKAVLDDLRQRMDEADLDFSNCGVLTPEVWAQQWIDRVSPAQFWIGRACQRASISSDNQETIADFADFSRDLQTARQLLTFLITSSSGCHWTDRSFTVQIGGSFSAIWKIMTGKRRKKKMGMAEMTKKRQVCLLYTSPSPRDLSTSRMPSSA